VLGRAIFGRPDAANAAASGRVDKGTTSLVRSHGRLLALSLRTIEEGQA